MFRATTRALRVASRQNISLKRSFERNAAHSGKKAPFSYTKSVKQQQPQTQRPDIISSVASTQYQAPKRKTRISNKTKAAMFIASGIILTLPSALFLFDDYKQTRAALAAKLEEEQQQQQQQQQLTGDQQIKLSYIETSVSQGYPPSDTETELKLRAQKKTNQPAPEQQQQQLPAPQPVVERTVEITPEPVAVVIETPAAAPVTVHEVVAEVPEEPVIIDMPVQHHAEQATTPAPAPAPAPAPVQQIDYTAILQEEQQRMEREFAEVLRKRLSQREAEFEEELRREREAAELRLQQREYEFEEELRRTVEEVIREKEEEFQLSLALEVQKVQDEDQLQTQLLLQEKEREFQHELDQERQRAEQVIQEVMHKVREIEHEWGSSIVQFASQAERARSLSSAVLNLSTVVEQHASYAPFKAEVDALLAAGKNDALVQSVVQSILAQDPELPIRGLPSHNTLREKFQTVSKRALTQAYTPDNAGLLGKVFSIAVGYLVIPERGLVDGNHVDARLARARYYIENDNLALALNEVEKIDGAPGEVVSEWVKEARNRIQVEQLLQALKAHTATLAPQNQ